MGRGALPCKLGRLINRYSSNIPVSNLAEILAEMALLLQVLVQDDIDI